MKDDAANAAAVTGDATEESFYSGAYRRIVLHMLWLAGASAAALWVRYGWRFGVAFVLGCGLAFLNFYWLKRVISGLADRATGTQQPQGSAGLVLRFLLRYALAGLAAYVILRSSVLNVFGLLAGLFLPVAAIFMEAAYEVYAALRRDV